MNDLIPKNLLKTIPKFYETEEQINPIAYVKLFLDAWPTSWFVFAGYSLVVAIAFAFIFRYKYNSNTKTN